MKSHLKGLVLAGLTSSTALLASTANAVEIEYWQYFFDARVEAMETLIDNFEAANPDITVTMTHFPYADYRTKVAAAIPAGEGPDVVQLFYGWLNDYVQAELIQVVVWVAFTPLCVVPTNVGFRQQGRQFLLKVVESTISTPVWLPVDEVAVVSGRCIRRHSFDLTEVAVDVLVW